MTKNVAVNLNTMANFLNEDTAFDSTLGSRQVVKKCVDLLLKRPYFMDIVFFFLNLWVAKVVEVVWGRYTINNQTITTENTSFVKIVTK